jgi:hypothetical protein
VLLDDPLLFPEHEDSSFWNRDMRCFFTLALLVIPATAIAQNSRLSVGARVRVQAPGILEGDRTGTLLRVSDDSASVKLNGAGTLTFPLSGPIMLEVSEGRSRAKGVKVGALIGAPLGLGAAYFAERGKDPCGTQVCALVHDRQSEDAPPSVGKVVAGAAIGAGAGAALGLLFGRERWTAVERTTRVSIVGWPGAEIAARLSLSVR